MDHCASEPINRIRENAPGKGARKKSRAGLSTSSAQDSARDWNSQPFSVPDHGSTHFFPEPFLW